jgi:hypothetical protein
VLAAKNAQTDSAISIDLMGLVSFGVDMRIASGPGALDSRSLAIPVREGSPANTVCAVSRKLRPAWSTAIIIGAIIGGIEQFSMSGIITSLRRAVAVPFAEPQKRTNLGRW